MAEPKGKGRNAKPSEDKEQAERFKATARELGVDESGQSFEKLAEKILKPKQRHSL